MYFQKGLESAQAIRSNPRLQILKIRASFQNTALQGVAQRSITKAKSTRTSFITDTYDLSPSGSFHIFPLAMYGSQPRQSWPRCAALGSSKLVYRDSSTITIVVTRHCDNYYQPDPKGKSWRVSWRKHLLTITRSSLAVVWITFQMECFSEEWPHSEKRDVSTMIAKYRA